MNNAFINSYFFYGSVYGQSYLDEFTKPNNPHDGILNYIKLDDKKGCNEFLKNLITSIFIHENTYIKTCDLFILFK